MFDLFNNIVPFLVILTVLVFVHELGHYLVARYHGVKVEVFSIGFGHEIFGFNDIHGTRWKFSLIPLGGYVKMHGDADAASSKQKKNVNKKLSFYHKTLLQRSLILFAGPAANFFFSFVVLVFINIFYGYLDNKPIISEIEKSGGADIAGLKVGDLILQADKKPVHDLISLKEILIKHDNSKIELTISRDNKIVDFVVSIKNNRIGIKGTVENKKLSIFNSCAKSIEQLSYFVKMTLVGIYEMVIGSRGTEDLGGPIRIAELATEFWSKGLQDTLWLMMIISLNLGLINLFPIPMLDGGHLMFNFFELLNGKPLNERLLEILHTMGFVMLISLMLFAFYNDISRYFN